MLRDYPIFKHLLYWLIAFSLLTFIYGTAFDSFNLGTKVILILLPVHMCYFYLITYFILPRFFFRGRYIQAFFAVLATMIFIATLYRVTEVFISDPYIYKFYKAQDANFTWSKMNHSLWEQLNNRFDFVNAIERSNSVIWICVTLRMFIMWQERKQAALQAELNFLKAQLHPHFLFNALNNLYALSLDNAPQTPEIILGISNILRYVLYECSADKVLLKRDLEVLNDYIRLEKLRYEERLELNVNIRNNAGDQEISPLLMLPLVENAFKHGAAETVDAPWINIEIYASSVDLIVKISNSKPEQAVAYQKRSNAHIGMTNVEKRLKLLYPEMHTFKWYDEEDCFITELKVQLIKP
ncbi:sensor histidine kinase [Chitinophaga niabensis]|uniref:Histidine kinase n=1 Tax=Chitinophaga niabensis TaxID=536979 RepID=A0A1N6IWV3_9BACT|nr:histidine kinase [Chitinophaga niabensis]SIO36520.1 Histidine kinase [Chitinophaga niabensis]